MPARSTHRTKPRKNVPVHRRSPHPGATAWGDDGRNPNVSYGDYQFTRTGATVPFKGTLTLDWLTFETVDPDVLAISRGTVELEWWNGAERLKHRPTYTVARRGRAKGETLFTHVEVIGQRAFDRPEVRSKFARLQADARRRLLDFRVRTQVDLVQPRFDNAKLVERHAGAGQIPAADGEALSAFSRSRSTFTLEQVVEATVLDYPRAYAAVLNRVASGRLTIDLGTPFGRRSQIGRTQADA